MMANGQVVILAGTDENGDNVPVPEVWASGNLTTLPAASRMLTYYPRAFLAPNGRLFYAGDQATTRYLNFTGAGAWTTVATRQVANRNYGSAAMYEPGKIVYAGGGNTTNTAEIIDLNQSPPRWTLDRRDGVRASASQPDAAADRRGAGDRRRRRHRPSTTSPSRCWRRRSGTPQTGTWRTLASNAVTRGYHGTSILLPDGRVLNSGSGDGVGAPRQLNAELFSPPYLFAGPRPTIGSAPATVRYNTTFRVATPQRGHDRQGQPDPPGLDDARVRPEPALSCR